MREMLKSKINIIESSISSNSSPYVIAEVGSNHDQDLIKAKELIDVAVEAKAGAVKFQLFRADALYPNHDGLYDIFKSLELNAGWVPELSEYARRRGIHFLASAFDEDSVDVLELVGVPAHKIASSEATNWPLIHKMAVTKKPLIISTGMCDVIDIEEAINVARGAANEEIILMQCGAVYPLENKSANIKVIQTLYQRFSCPVGFSDHTLGNTAAVVAIGAGATVFEKHFTLDKKADGPDHFYALEPAELENYISSLGQAYESLGSEDKQLLTSERELGRREGLYFTRDMEVGEIIMEPDLVSSRPALGIRDRYTKAVVGASLLEVVKKGQSVSWSHIGRLDPKTSFE